MAHTNPVLSAPHTQARAKVKHGRSTSSAYAQVIACAEDTVCHALCLNELITVVLNRIKETNGLEFVSKDTLFKLYMAVDSELESRADLQASEHTEPIRVDQHSPSEFRSVWDDDEMTEAHMVRAIHAEVFDIDEE